MTSKEAAIEKLKEIRLKELEDFSIKLQALCEEYKVNFNVKSEIVIIDKEVIS